MEKSKISLVFVMLTTKYSSNFNRGNVNYEGILNEKSKTPQILTKKSYIMRGFLMEKSNISLVTVRLTTKDPLNFNRGNVNFEEILNETK